MTDAERITELLWRMFSGEQQNGENILSAQKADILAVVGALPENQLGRLDRILLYYECRWVGANAIQDSKCFYEDFAADNERLVALTSIVDFLANEVSLSKTAKRVDTWYCRATKRLAESICGPLIFGGAGKGFTAFLRKFLTDADFDLIKGKYVLRKKGRPKQLQRFEDMTSFVYFVRSLVVHAAELGGVWPFNFQLTHDPKTGQLDRGVETVLPSDFRRLLWRAIFRSFGLEIVRW